MKLHTYQRQAIEFLHGRRRAGLFLDMGLGKTAICLSALTPEHLPALVVAPKKVAENTWPTERDLWRPDLSMSVAAGEPTQRIAAFHDRSDITVVSRDNVLWARDAKLLKGYRTVILDELSSFKTKSSGRWRGARAAVTGADHIWGLTGTPTPNGLLDLFAQIFLLDGGARLGTRVTGFRDRYFVPAQRIADGTVVSWDPRPETEARLHELLEDLCLYMSSDDKIQLPDITVNTVPVRMPPRTTRAYTDMAGTLVADLTDVIGGDVHTAASTAVVSAKLSQAAAGFMYKDELAGITHLDTVKIDTLRDMLEAIGSPVLCFYRFVEERDRLLSAFPAAVPIERPGAIGDWNAGKVPLLVAHPASAGHGLNLQHGGHHIVWTSPTWSLEEWEQGNARLHRQGQTQPVVVHCLLAERSVDFKVQARLAAKAQVQDNLLAYLESPL